MNCQMSQMSEYFCGVLQAEVASIAQQHGFLVTLSSYGLQRGPFLLSVISTMGQKCKLAAYLGLLARPDRDVFTP